MGLEYGMRTGMHSELLDGGHPVFGFSYSTEFSHHFFEAIPRPKPSPLRLVTTRTIGMVYWQLGIRAQARRLVLRQQAVKVGGLGIRPGALRRTRGQYVRITEYKS